jgi:hypothetical protein
MDAVHTQTCRCAAGALCVSGKNTYKKREINTIMVLLNTGFPGVYCFENIEGQNVIESDTKAVFAFIWLIIISKS